MKPFATPFNPKMVIIGEAGAAKFAKAKFYEMPRGQEAPRQIKDAASSGNASAEEEGQSSDGDAEEAEAEVCYSEEEGGDEEEGNPQDDDRANEEGNGDEEDEDEGEDDGDDDGAGNSASAHIAFKTSPSATQSGARLTAYGFTGNPTSR